MAEIKLAKVRFRNENKDYNVLITDIREKTTINGKSRHISFNPENFEDFKRQAWYLVKWQCNDEECSTKIQHHHYWKAYILCLGENEEDLQKRCTQQRLKYPKKLDTTSSSDESSSSSGDKENVCKKKSVNSNNFELLQKRMKILQTNREFIFNKNESFCEDDRSTESSKELLNDDKHASEYTLSNERTSSLHTHNKLNIVKLYTRSIDRKLASCEEDRASEESLTLEAVNNNVQIAFTNVRSIKKQYLNKSVMNVNTEGQRYEEKNEKVYLGLDIWIDKEPWLVLQLQKKPTIFLRDLAEILWTTKKLANRCFKIHKVDVKNVDATSPRKEFEPDRLQLLQELYEDYLKKRGIQEQNRKQYLKDMRRILSYKIQDLRAHYRRINKM